jgi:glyoxylase-like metal-dependent hydrolase (beta-lactamase superfamily II)
VAALEDGARLRLAGHELEVLFTPGHATHHAAVRHLASGAVFAGDVAGVRVPGAGVINPPTVPPEFDLAAWELSIDRLLSLDPPMLLLGHFGPYTDARAHLKELRRRLHAWTDFVRAGLAAGRTPEEMGAELEQRDVTLPGTSAEGVHRLELVAGYGMSVAGIARYLSRQ